MPAKKKKPKEPEPAPESKGKKDKKKKEKEGAQDKEDPPQKGKVPVSKVRLRGTCVPPLCTRLFPVVPDVPVPGYTCTRVLYPLVPPCPRCPIAMLLHCRSPALPAWSRRSRAGPVRSKQRVRAVIGRQQVTGISAARCVFPIPFPCHCIYEFSLSPCPPVHIRFQKKLQDLFEMEPARIRAHYRTCLASGDKKSQSQNRALLAGMFFFWFVLPRRSIGPCPLCLLQHPSSSPAARRLMYWTSAVGSAASTATGRTRQKPCSLKRRGVRPRVNTGLQVCVCLPTPGTRVPAFCTRLFPRVRNVLERGYTCTRVLYPLVPPCPRRSRTRVHVYPRFVPAFPSVLHTFFVVYR